MFRFIGFCVWWLCCEKIFAKDIIKPNILVILADDLGYGDLSVQPFSRHGIKTPELEKMAQSGLIMTNFHDAAPVCTPTRASILTGLFPWRLGIYSIYGTGRQAKEHLSVVPNLPLVFKDAGYHTSHIGKWHLGAMRPSDLIDRNLKLPFTTSTNITACNGVNPGPLQHGFMDYIAMEEGAGSQRISTLIPKSMLYHHGAKRLIHNDQKVTPSESDEILTDRQTTEAIRIITENVQRNQPFYMHLWFDAPHGPWETIKPFDSWYEPTQWEGGRESRNFKYATMVSSMDYNIGRIRRTLQELGVENNTLVVFLSDNGPEGGAGSAGPFRGGKRSLHEGGIRVPCIWQWTGKIAPNTTSDVFTLSTDLFPTFMEAAGIARPLGLKLDGMSVLSTLLGTTGSKTGKQRGDERTVTWYKDIDGVSSAAWMNGYKYLSDEHGVQHVYDIQSDPTEKINLINITSSALSITPTPPVHTRTAVRIGHQKISQISRITTQIDTKAVERTSIAVVDKVMNKLRSSAEIFVKNGNKAHLSHTDLKRCHYNVSGVRGFDWSMSAPSVPEL